MRIRIIPAIFALAFVAGCASPEKEWKATKAQDRAGSYQAYISKFPNSPFTGEARQRIAQLEWEEVARQDNLFSYRRYLQSHPTGEFAAKAKTRVEEIAWNQAKSQKTIKGYEEFMHEYPASNHKEEAEKAISGIKRAEEDRSYKQAVESGAYSALKSFLSRYPSSRYSEDVTKRLAQFAWETLKEARLLSWQMIGKELLTSVGLADKISKSAFGGIAPEMKVEGKHISPITDILFVEGGSRFDSTSFVVEGGNGHVLFLRSQGKEGILLIFPNVIIPVGSSFIMDTSGTTSQEASSRSVPNSRVIASGYTTSGGQKLDYIDLFGTICRSGTVKVVAGGLELQPGCEVLTSNAGKTSTSRTDNRLEEPQNPTAKVKFQLKNYNSPFVALAASLLLLTSCSNPERDFQKAKKTDTQEAYETFIAKHPSSSLVKEARSRIEANAYEATRSAATVVG